MNDVSGLQERIAAYLAGRLEQYAGWYDKKAVVMKRHYMRSRIAAASGAVLIPVINSISFEVRVGGYGFDVPRVFVGAIGLIVALLLALEGVLHHKEQWQNYRSTEQFLRAQRVLFENRVGEYAMLADDEALRKLIEKVEGAIKDENEVTLNVLTRSETKPSEISTGGTS